MNGSFADSRIRQRKKRSSNTFLLLCEYTLSRTLNSICLRVAFYCSWCYDKKSFKGGVCERERQRIIESATRKERRSKRNPNTCLLKHSFFWYFEDSLAFLKGKVMPVGISVAHDLVQTSEQN